MLSLKVANIFDSEKTKNREIFIRNKKIGIVINKGNA